MMYKKRGFVAVGVPKPQRSTEGSAGYDFRLPRDITLFPNDVVMMDSGVRAYMRRREVLLLHIRSSLGKIGVNLTNCTGVIDSDYFNTGQSIKVMLANRGEKVVKLKAGDKYMQGIFSEYLITDDDRASNQRKGGVGSTGR